MDILKHLQDYADSDYVPMHMPGSKRNTQIEDIFGMNNLFSIDITEIDGFDNMHNANGIIKKAFDRAARLYGAKESLFLVNGSTSGNLAAICGVTNKNDTVLVARNCHCSVYNAIILNELNPIYVTPECDSQTGIFKGVTLEEVKGSLEKYEEENNNRNKEEKKGRISAVIITSPTYEGNVSQIREISEYLHKKHIPLIVDEAHGAHFTFSDSFPESAVKAGADIVINSLHKTLPVLTQSAIMHMNGELIDYNRVKRYWSMFQTTSPSYILLSSMDRCFEILEKYGDELFIKYIERLTRLRNTLKKLKNLRLEDTDDISKLIIKCDDGKALNDCLLEKYHIQLEMSSFKYVIAMTSFADTDEYYERFANALSEIDKTMESNGNISGNTGKNLMDNIDTSIEKIGQGQMLMKPSDAVSIFERDGGQYINPLNFDFESDYVCAQQILIYPPGMPVLNPGEKVTVTAVGIINAAVNCGLEVIGLVGGRIVCLK